MNTNMQTDDARRSVRFRPLGRIAALALALTSFAEAAPAQVEFWHVYADAPRKAWMQARASEFSRAHPEVQVVPVVYPNYPGAFQALATAARSGHAPALVLISEAGTQLAVDSMLFRPLPGPAVAQLSDMLPAVRNYYTVGTRMYAVPFNTSSPVLYANQKLLRAAGLDPRQLPQTLEGLQQACETLGRATPGVTCMTFPVDTWYFEQWAAQQGRLWVDHGNGHEGRATRTYLNSAAVAGPLRWLQEMRRSGAYVNPGGHENNAGAVALFLKGNTAFLMNSSSRIGQILDGSSAAGFAVKVGLMPVPSGTARQGLVVGGSSLWIPRELPATTAQAAQDFALFLTSTANLASWHRLSGYDPLRASSVQVLQAQNWFRAGEPHTVAFEQFRATRPTLATAGARFGSFYEVRSVLLDAIDRVLAGADVQGTLDAAKARADQILRAYNARF